MIVLCDVDGVVADLLPTWLSIYNGEAGDSLKVEDITAWELKGFVKKEYGQKVYDILHYPGLYDAVRPVKGALAGVEYLRSRGHRVVFVTSCNEVTAASKIRWLVRNGFLKDAKHASLRDYVMASDKSLVLPQCVLIDDYADNFAGRDDELCILVDQPYNRESHYARAGHWGEIVDRVAELAEPRGALTVG